MKLKQIIHNLKVQLGEFRMSIRYALLGLLSKKNKLVMTCIILFKNNSFIFGIQVIHKCIKNYQKWSRITWLRSNIFIKKEVQIKNIFFDERGRKGSC